MPGMALVFTHCPSQQTAPPTLKSTPVSANDSLAILQQGSRSRTAWLRHSAGVHGGGEWGSPSLQGESLAGGASAKTWTLFPSPLEAEGPCLVPGRQQHPARHLRETCVACVTAAVKSRGSPCAARGGWDRRPQWGSSPRRRCPHPLHRSTPRTWPGWENDADSHQGPSSARTLSRPRVALLGRVCFINIRY